MNSMAPITLTGSAKDNKKGLAKENNAFTQLLPSSYVLAMIG